MDSPDRPAPDRRDNLLWLGAALVWAALLFAQLGHYALWDDEALTALAAKAVQATGDTGVLLDHGNIVAYRDGLSISGFADRATPPLAAYVTALSFDCFGISAYTARLPFALFGLGTGLLLMLWARDTPAPGRWVLVAALIGNVSLILFCRQCRYYAPAIFFSTAIVFVLWRWRPGWKQLLTIAALSICLFASNFMTCVALYAALAVDYVFWRRREQPLGFRDAAILFLPQIVLDGAIASVWNPFHTAFGSYESANTFFDHIVLFFRSWRDMDRSEFCALPALLLALGAGLWLRRMWLVRGCVALAVFTLVVAFISPQIVKANLEAEVRYLAPILPLAIALQAGALAAVFGRNRWLLVTLAALTFGTNLFNGGPFFPWGVRSSLLSYLGELSMPQDEPYTPTAAWINANVPPNASVWATPYYTAYPLMFAAPNVHYAWQLTWPPKDHPQLASLPPIDFGLRVSPDYIVAFGPQQQLVAGLERQKALPDFHYEQVQTIPVFWKDFYRPELYWRRFDTLTGFDPAVDGVFIYKKKP